MSTQTFTKRHSDNDGDWNPLEWGSGTDTFHANIPAGEKFVQCSLAKDCFLGDCFVTTAPRYGTEGQVTVKVKWNYVSWGKANYTLRVSTETKAASTPLEIVFGTHNWEENLKGAINAGRPVRVKVTGPQAILLYPLIWANSLRDLEDTVTELADSPERNTRSLTARFADPVSITLIICSAIVASIIFASLGAALILAIQKGKCAKASTGDFSLPTGKIGQVVIDIHDCGKDIETDEPEEDEEKKKMMK